MNSESDLWSYVRARLAPHGDLIRVENRLGEGTPDVNYALRYHGAVLEGWLELKWTPCPPRIKSLTLEQVVWQATRERAGGRVGTLLGAVGIGVLYLPPAGVRAVWDRRVPETGLLGLARGYSLAPTAGDLLRWLAS